MTISEFRNIVNASPHKEFFENATIQINLPHLQFSTLLQGYEAIFEFLNRQSSNWSKIQEALPEELQRSKELLGNSFAEFIALKDEPNNPESGRKWRILKSNLENTQNAKPLFLAEFPETTFLINLHRTTPNYYRGAVNYILGTISYTQLNYAELTGAMMAYEFKSKDNSELLSRKNAEISSLSKTRNDFYEYLNQAGNDVTSIVNTTNNTLKNFVEEINTLKKNHEEDYLKWSTKAVGDFSSYLIDAKQKITDLAKAYEDLLRLKQPAAYWRTRADTLKSEGRTAIKWLIYLITFSCVTLYFLLWLTPDGMLLSFIKGQASAIKWSIVYITFISFLAYGIRSVAKVMFSSFHLARDAEEREQLTYVYLALIKEGATDEKERALIMQSLFSRADTGLLKEDSSPSMPGGIVEKIASK